MGVGVPIPDWFRNRGRARWAGRVLARDARSFEGLRGEPVEASWDAHQGGGIDHGHRLWALLTLETWLRQNT